MALRLTQKWAGPFHRWPRAREQFAYRLRRWQTNDLHQSNNLHIRAYHGQDL